MKNNSHSKHKGFSSMRNIFNIRLLIAASFLLLYIPLASSAKGENDSPGDTGTSASPGATSKSNPPSTPPTPEDTSTENKDDAIDSDGSAPGCECSDAGGDNNRY